jgi:hypothetical protein
LGRPPVRGKELSSAQILKNQFHITIFTPDPADTGQLEVVCPKTYPETRIIESFLYRQI